MKFSQPFLPQTNCVIGKNTSKTVPSLRKDEDDGVGNRGKGIEKFAAKLQDRAWG